MATTDFFLATEKDDWS